MKRLVFLVAALLMLLLCGCNGNTSDVGFIARMSGYVAAEVNSTYNIAFTCFFEDTPPFEMNEIHKIAFDGIDTAVIVDNLTVEIEKTKNKYSLCVLTLEIEFAESGIFQTEYLCISLASGMQIKYPIDTWTFDVIDSKALGAVNDVHTFSSPAVSTNGKRLAYSYQLGEGVLIHGIQTNVNEVHSASNGLPAEGTLALSGNAQINYIREKILYSVNNTEYIALGIGCYCGAMNIDEKILEEMKIWSLPHITIS